MRCETFDSTRLSSSFCTHNQYDTAATNANINHHIYDYGTVCIYSPLCIAMEKPTGESKQEEQHVVDLDPSIVLIILYAIIWAMRERCVC